MGNSTKEVKETKAKTPFEVMYGVNIKDSCENKDGLNYLQWAKAVKLMSEADPNFTYKVKMFDNGQGRLVPYVFDEALGYMVFTEITSNGITKEMWQVVMENHGKTNFAMKREPYKVPRKKNNGETYDIDVNACDMFAINRTIMRCLVKNMAMFGLGLKVYEGEDIEDEPIEIAKINEAQVKKIKELQAQLGFTDVYMEKALKGKTVEDLNTNQAEEMINGFTKMLKDREAKGENENK